MHTDRVVRLNPKTGGAVQYLMPTDTNMRPVFIDNSTTPVKLWVGSNHDHRLVRGRAARPSCCKRDTECSLRRSPPVHREPLDGL
jgi:hypothetical protein